jgi:L-aspartate oxidase
LAGTNRIRCDLLVIGCGIAGAAAAIKAADAGLDVVVTTKEEELLEANTRWAQGGIIGTGPDDTEDLLYSDVMRAGAGLNNPHAVRIFCEEGPRQVDAFLVNRLKVPFSRDKRGRILHTAEAAHSRRRIYFKEDRTGYAIHVSCIKAMKAHRNIRILPRHMAVDIITIPHHSRNPLDVYQPTRAAGAYVLEVGTGKVLTILAPKTVIATGGMGHTYLHTTNPAGATGDGFAMAYRAGARCINMEYVQFHPTTLHHVSAPGFLITEAVRGEGAKLKNLRGEYFMSRYDRRKELAPRDVVTRSIYEEISSHKEEFALLDLSTIPKRIDVTRRFPQVAMKLKPLGIDIAKDPIPVVPAAHYQCGGVQTDEWGRVEGIHDLFAVGEVACTGLHGANRLASTSLLEGLVWGCRAGNYVAETSNNSNGFRISDIPNWRAVRSREPIDPVLVSQDLMNVRTTMWNYVGIVRTRKRLDRARADLDYLSHRVERFYREIPLRRDLIELRNALIVARTIAAAASSNQTSRGCHYRVD